MTKIAKAPHNEKINYHNHFSITSKQSLHEIRQSGYDITVASAIFHIIRCHPGQCIFSLSKQLEIKEGTVSARLRELVELGLIYKAYDSRNDDPRSNRMVHHYKATDIHLPPQNTNK